MDPAINREGSTDDEWNQVGGTPSIIQPRSPKWKSSSDLCAVLHNTRCKLCKDWAEHHDDDPTSFEQAKVTFYTGRDQALVLKKAHLELEAMDAKHETNELRHELHKVRKETERVQRDQQTIEDAGRQLQLQVVGKIHENIDESRVESFDARSASSESESEPSSRPPCKRLRHTGTHTFSQVGSFDARSATPGPSSGRPRKRRCHTPTSSQSRPTTPDGPFATEQPIYVSSGSES